VAIEFHLVPGPDFAPQASSILTAAWPAPALHYTPEYLRWQMSFPGPTPTLASAPAATAFVDSTPAGFAGSTHRRLRHGSQVIDILLVSFVAVHPDFRNRGIAAGLYRTLLAAIAATRLPVVTFAQTGSAAQRAIERAYPEAGFQLRSLGSYPGFACVPRASQETQWIREENTSPVDGSSIEAAVDSCAADLSLLWNAPTDAQWRHYKQDPRPRGFLSLATGDGEMAAAWTVQTAYVTAQGLDSVAAIDCVWLNRARPDLLSGLATAVARISPAANVVNASSLARFDPKLLRQAGFRQVSNGFHGYCATAPDVVPLPEAAAISCEIV
jgi:GNAT superfamily N-acetyltransferase